VSKVLNVIAHLLVAIPGAVFGAALGFRLVVASQDPVVFFGVIAGFSLLCASLSMRLGLRFWEAIGQFRGFGRRL